METGFKFFLTIICGVIPPWLISLVGVTGALPWIGNGPIIGLWAISTLVAGLLIFTGVQSVQNKH